MADTVAAVVLALAMVSVAISVVGLIGCGIAYFAFDLLHLDGHDLRRCPLEDRKALLRDVVGAARCPRIVAAGHDARRTCSIWRAPSEVLGAATTVTDTTRSTLEHGKYFTMPTDQNQADDFNADVTLAENRKQNALRQAQEAFDAERLDNLAKWSDKVQGVQAELDEAQGRIDALRRAPPDHAQARDRLAAAVAKADADYLAEVAALREQHGVVTVPAGR